MTDGLPPSGFTAVCNRSLRAAGLSGDRVTVELAGKALLLSGSDAGTLKLDAAMVDRVRFGYFQGKYRRVFNAGIRLLGKDKWLTIEPAASSDALAYGAAMRGFARAIAGSRGIATIECGLSGVTALFMLAFLMLPPVALVVIAVMFAPNLLVQAALVATAALLAGSGVWLYLKRQRPKGVASLEEIEVQLPDPVSGA